MSGKLETIIKSTLTAATLAFTPHALAQEDVTEGWNENSLQLIVELSAENEAEQKKEAELEAYRKSFPKPEDINSVFTIYNIDIKKGGGISDDDTVPKITQFERDEGFLIVKNEAENKWFKLHQENLGFIEISQGRYQDGDFQNKLFGIKPTLTEEEKLNRVYLERHPRSGLPVWEKIEPDNPNYFYRLASMTEDNKRPSHLGKETETERLKRLEFMAYFTEDKPELSEELRKKGFIVMYSEISESWVQLHQSHDLFHKQTDGRFDDGIQNDLYPYKPKLSLKDEFDGAVVVGFPTLGIWEISRKNNPKHKEYAKTLDDKLAKAGLTRYQYNRGITTPTVKRDPNQKRRIVNGLDLGPAPDDEGDDVYVSPPQRDSTTVVNNRPVSWMDTYVPGSGLDPRIRNVIFASPVLRKQYERESRAAMNTMGLNPMEFDQQANFEFMMGFNRGFTQARNKPYKTINDLNREAGRGYSLGGGMRINGRGEAYTENDDGGWNREPAFDQ